MKIKKKITDRTPSGEVEKLQKARAKRNGTQYELDPYVDHKPKENDI
ncbi:hypothetical protein LCGC14_0651180 [marine sediment metagenome]|uniref:Uncharacterized protein n=1 Tax=marine sediment metagenome TaxID=412755 RepID=A0A0F9R1I5_9ZZZZ